MSSKESFITINCIVTDDDKDGDDRNKERFDRAINICNWSLLPIEKFERKTVKICMSKKLQTDPEYQVGK